MFTSLAVVHVNKLPPSVFLPSKDINSTGSTTDTITFELGTLTQLFAPVHLAKNVLLDVIVGVLLGNATVGLAASYQISVPEQPLAVRVVVLPDETDEGVAVGAVGADVVLTVTLPIVAGFEVQTLAFWTVNV